MLIINPIGIINRPTVVPIAIAAAAGHPTSTVVSDKWNLVAICCTAGARYVPINPTARFNPMKPTPTVRPPLKALPNLAPKITPKIVKMIGIMTLAPKPLI